MAEPNFKNRTLYHGDNLDFLRGMNSKTVDLIATDPPFKKERDFHATPDSLSAGAKFQDRWSWDRDVHEDWVDSLVNNWPKTYNVIQGSRNSYGDDMGAFLCFMAVRLIEMRRVLKDTGSIYLHCDHTASHYLKELMDAIFGRKNFRNEVVWCYKSGGASPKKYFSKKHDTIFWYTVGQQYTFNPQKEKSYNRKLKPYRFSGVEEFQDKIGWYTIVGMKDYWNIDMVGRTSEERTGYPTQKPLALYERIITASSNEGDLVLDPFCGCATTPVAAERLNRQWVGVDIWEKAHEVVIGRLTKEGLISPEGDTGGKLFTKGQIHYTKEPPVRTDKDEETVPYLKVQERKREESDGYSNAERKAILLERMAEGYCGKYVCEGCFREFDHKRYFVLDHVTPRVDGGSNNIHNRMLLCWPCNLDKSNDKTLSGLHKMNMNAGTMKPGVDRKAVRAYQKKVATKR